jgi:hypothetical protein
MRSPAASVRPASRPRRALPWILALAGALVLARAVVGAAPRARCGGVWTRLDTETDCGACGVRCAATHGAAACVDGRCALTCAAGFADCDAHPGNGCEVELRADRAHCGLCGRSCAGAACAEGACAARYLGFGTRIVAGVDAVYARAPLPVRFPVDGTDPVSVAADAAPLAGAPAAAATRLVDGDLAYWVEADPGGGAVVKRGPASGGEGAVVATHPTPLRELTGNATHLFWVDAKERIFMAPKKPR